MKQPFKRNKEVWTYFLGNYAKNYISLSILKMPVQMKMISAVASFRTFPEKDGAVLWLLLLRSIELLSFNRIIQVLRDLRLSGPIIVFSQINTCAVRRALNKLMAISFGTENNEWKMRKNITHILGWANTGRVLGWEFPFGSFEMGHFFSVIDCPWLDGKSQRILIQM